jgi:hypothetical protein
MHVAVGEVSGFRFTAIERLGEQASEHGGEHVVESFCEREPAQVEYLRQV